MSEVTIEKIFSKVKETKFGNKLSVGLKIVETSVPDINGDMVDTAGKYINGWFKEDFQFPFNEGEKVEILIKQRGEYLDFQLPGVGKAPQADNSKLAERVKKLEERMDAMDGGVVVAVDEEPDVSDVDF